MRFGRPLPLVALLLALTTAAAPAAADFSAGGKKKGKTPPSGATGGANPGGGTKPGGGATGGTKPREPKGDEPKGPGTDALIARYTGIVLAQPASPFPLQRLAQLYRDRDGNLKKLLEDLEKRAGDTSSRDAWPARVALAGLLKQEGRGADALKAYESAIAERPKEASVRLALADLLKERGDRDAARKQYDEALALLTAPIDREQTLRSLRSLMLDGKQYDAAKDYHDKLVKVSSSLAVRGELGRELLARGEAARAEGEFKELVKAAAGDNRALAPALLDLGRAQAAQKKNKDALDTLKRALSAAGSEAGVRGEILAVIAEVFRADNNLGELIALFEKENVSDFPRLVMLGSLYEETGNVAKAIATYRKALGQNGKHIETRLRVVRLLQAQGELDQAIAENERLIQAAPRNPDFVFQLCETLLARGDRARALDLLSKLERSAARDEDVLTRVADFYERIEEKDRATKIFAHLTSVSPNDPAHLVELGDRFWQAGDKKKAMETWQRIRTAVPNKAKALSALGEVLLDHDMVAEALAALKEAADAEPSNVRLKKSFAVALERAATGVSQGALRNARFDEARAAWEEILEKAGADRLLAREARTHLVTLWSLLKQLEQKVEPLRRRLMDDPPDLEAGRLLAEVQIRLRKLDGADQTLSRVTEKAPGDEEAFLALERVRVMQRDLPGAIKALERLAEINPKRAREFYHRMAQYSAELYKDDDAIRYSEKAVALSPEDADGHKKLAEMYRRRGDADKAIASFRMAIQKNDRLFPVYMELAELLVAKGEADDADRLYRRVVRSAPDEELVAQAGRLSMQRNLAKGTLVDLENELLPLTLGHPNRRVYRRLLVDVYGQMTFPLMARVRFGTRAEADDARDKLMKIGARGVKPLLDALADEQKAQTSTALEVLSYVGNKGAGSTLAAFAVGTAEQPLRVRAMVATGALRDPALLVRYEELVAPKDMEAVAPGDPVTIAAAWGVARMGDKKSVPLLSRMLSSGAPEVRAFGAIGLALAHDKGSAPALEALARGVDTAPVARAAAAWALGEIGAPSSASTLIPLATSDEALVRSAALSALVRLKDPSASRLALSSLFADTLAERKAAASALSLLATKEEAERREALPVPSGSLDARSVVESLLPRAASPSSLARTLAQLENEIAVTAAEAAKASPERATRVAEALLATADGAGLSPFTDDVGALSEPDRVAARRAAERVRKAVVPSYAALARHPSVDVKVMALRVLEGRTEDDALRAIESALGDPDETVLRAALSAAARSPGARATAPVTTLLSSSRAWALRVVAAETLVVVAKREGGAEADRAFAELAKAATSDAFSVVREAALVALAKAGAPGARTALEAARTKDVDPAVRKTAESLLSGMP